MLELREDAVVLSGIEFLLLGCFKKLKLKEKLEELIVALNIGLQVNREEGLNTLEALSIFAHGSIVNWITTVWLVLLSEYLPHPHQ